MNKNGFTLVELLATIVLLGLVITMAATKGFGAFDKTKDKILSLNNDAINEATRMLMTEIDNCNDDDDTELLNDANSTTTGFLASGNIDDLNNDGVISCEELKSSSKNGLQIKLSYLIDNGYLDKGNIDTDSYTDQDLTINASLTEGGK